MKSVFLFGTRMRMYLCEIPVIFLLAVSIYFNDKVDGALKLYPLILACCAAAIFMFVFLLRGISVSAEEVRSVGPFSSRDAAIIKKDITLVMTVMPGRKLRVELFGIDESPVFDWQKGNNAVEEEEINLYRDTAVGGHGSALRVLTYFGIDRGEAEEILGSDSFSATYDTFIFSKEKTEKGYTYTLKFTETV